MTDTARATGRPWALVRHFASAKVVKEIGPRSHRKIATVSAFGGLNDIDIANATLIISAVNEYDALKAVEAAARELATAVYAILEHGWDVATTEHVERVAIARLAVDDSINALDFLRHQRDSEQAR